MLTKENFECKRCGKCCRKYTVKLSNKDIRRIKKAGFRKEYFAEIDNFDRKYGNYALRRINNKCIFLTERHNKAYCQIYNNRPEICKDYPFIEKKEIDSCMPK